MHIGIAPIRVHGAIRAELQLCTVTSKVAVLAYTYARLRHKKRTIWQLHHHEGTDALPLRNKCPTPGTRRSSSTHRLKLQRQWIYQLRHFTKAVIGALTDHVLGLQKVVARHKGFVRNTFDDRASLTPSFPAGPGGFEGRARRRRVLAGEAVETTATGRTRRIHTLARYRDVWAERIAAHARTHTRARWVYSCKKAVDPAG